MSDADEPHPRERGLHRWQEHDYRTVGAYWVTADAHDRECTFGNVEDATMHLSPAGQIVQNHLNNLPTHFPVQVDTYVVMPNHVHAILVLLPKTANPLENLCSHSLSDVVGAFRRFSALEINKQLGREGVSVWQRNFYDRVIRDEHELSRFRRYCLSNPARWESGNENPSGNPGL